MVGKFMKKALGNLSVCFSLFIGVAMSSEFDTSPLVNFKSAVDFVALAENLGSDNAILETKLHNTISNTGLHYQSRIYVLSVVGNYASSKYPSVDTIVNSGILELLNNNYAAKGLERLNALLSARQMPNVTAEKLSYDLKIAHILWMSQTINCEGQSINEVYDAETLQTIFSILGRQKNGSLNAATVLHESIVSVLQAVKIDPRQFFE